MSKRVLITGAKGFLGSALLRYFTERGFDAVAFSRPRFELGGDIDRTVFSPAPQAVIHCAWDLGVKSRREAERVNIDGSLALKKICAEKGIHFVFISSMAAHAGAHSLYGRAKLAVEGALDQQVDFIIKPGTIIGKGGLFAKTLGLAKKFPVLPVFYRTMAQLQTVYIDDICEAIFNATDTNKSGVYTVAHNTPVAIEEFYKKVVQAAGKNPKLIPLPGNAALMLVRLCEMLGIKLPITSDNLLGLKYTHYVDTRESCRALGVTPRSFDDSLKMLKLL